MTDPEPESVRWVRYAADCAERVLPLTRQARPQAEAAIAAARAWADHPCEEHRRAAKTAAMAADDARITDDARIATNASWAAIFSARTADAAWSAASAAPTAADAAWSAAMVAHDGKTERAWQAERRKHYGLPEGRA